MSEPILSDTEIAETLRRFILPEGLGFGFGVARAIEAAVLAKQRADYGTFAPGTRFVSESDARTREREAFACGVAAERARMPLMDSSKWQEERDRRYPASTPAKEVVGKSGRHYKLIGGCVMAFGITAQLHDEGCFYPQKEIPTEDAPAVASLLAEQP